jgi:hypothetical protein
MATNYITPTMTENAVEDIIFLADEAIQRIDAGYHFLRRVTPKCCFQLGCTKASRAPSQD